MMAEHLNLIVSQEVNLAEKGSLVHWWPLLRFENGGVDFEHGARDLVGNAHGILRGSAQWINLPVQILPQTLQNLATKNLSIHDTQNLLIDGPTEVHDGVCFMNVDTKQESVGRSRIKYREQVAFIYGFDMGFNYNIPEGFLGTGTITIVIQQSGVLPNTLPDKRIPHEGLTIELVYTRTETTLSIIIPKMAPTQAQVILPHASRLRFLFQRNALRMIIDEEKEIRLNVQKSLHELFDSNCRYGWISIMAEGFDKNNSPGIQISKWTYEELNDPLIQFAGVASLDLNIASAICDYKCCDPVTLLEQWFEMGEREQQDLIETVTMDEEESNLYGVFDCGSFGTLQINESATKSFQGFHMKGSWPFGAVEGILYLDENNTWKFSGGWKHLKHDIYKPLRFDFKRTGTFHGQWFNLDSSGVWAGKKIDKQIGAVSGLINGGRNNCYMNSFLQCLANTYHVQEHLLHGISFEGLDIPSDGHDHVKITSALQSMLVKQLRSNCITVDPTPFKQALPLPWSLENQQDVSEFGQYLLDQMAEAAKTLKVDSKNGRAFDLFRGQTTTVTECTECNQVFDYSQDFRSLALAIPDSSQFCPITDIRIIDKRHFDPEWILVKEPLTTLPVDDKQKLYLCYRRDPSQTPITAIKIIRQEDKMTEKDLAGFQPIEGDLNGANNGQWICKSRHLFVSRKKGSPITSIDIVNCEQNLNPITPENYELINVNINASRPKLSEEQRQQLPNPKKVYLAYTHRGCPVVEISILPSQKPNPDPPLGMEILRTNLFIRGSCHHLNHEASMFYAYLVFRRGYDMAPITDFKIISRDLVPEKQEQGYEIRSLGFLVEENGEKEEYFYSYIRGEGYPIENIDVYRAVNKQPKRGDCFIESIVKKQEVNQQMPDILCSNWASNNEEFSEFLLTPDGENKVNGAVVSGAIQYHSIAKTSLFVGLLTPSKDGTKVELRAQVNCEISNVRYLKLDIVGHQYSGHLEISPQKKHELSGMKTEDCEARYQISCGDRILVVDQQGMVSFQSINNFDCIVKLPGTSQPQYYMADIYKKVHSEGVLLRTWLGQYLGVQSGYDSEFVARGDMAFNSQRVGLHWFINDLGNGNIRLQNETGFLLCVLPDGSTILKDVDSINDFPSETLVSTFNITELPNADPHSQFSEFAGTYISTNVDIMMYVHRDVDVWEFHGKGRRNRNFCVFNPQAVVDEDKNCIHLIDKYRDVRANTFGMLAMTYYPQIDSITCDLWEQKEHTSVSLLRDDYVSVGVWYSLKSRFSKERSIVPVPKIEQNIQSLLNQQFEPEYMDYANQYFCSNCDRKTRAKKRICMTLCPDYLILSLSRFYYDSRTMSMGKVLHEINFRPQVMVEEIRTGKRSNRRTVILDPLKEKNSSVSWNAKPEEEVNTQKQHKVSVLYGLYAVIYHSGITADSGHYYAYVRDSSSPDGLLQKNDDQAPWYRVEDDKVQKVNWNLLALNQQREGDTPYMFLYRRLKPGVEQDLPLIHDPNMSDISEIIRKNIQFQIKKSRPSIACSSYEKGKAFNRIPYNPQRFLTSTESLQNVRNIGIYGNKKEIISNLNKRRQCRFCGSILVEPNHEIECRYRKMHVVKSTISDQYVFLKDFEKHEEKMKEKKKHFQNDLTNFMQILQQEQNKHKMEIENQMYPEIPLESEEANKLATQFISDLTAVNPVAITTKEAIEPMEIENL